MSNNDTINLKKLKSTITSSINSNMDTISMEPTSTTSPVIDVKKNKAKKKKLIIVDDEQEHATQAEVDAVSKPKLTKSQQKEENERFAKESDKETTDEVITDNITLYHGDCIEKMKLIPDDSVDLVLCDLPYGSTKCKWDSIINFDDLWSHYKRIIKKPSGVIVLFGQQPFTTKLISSNYEWFKYNLIWKKNKTTQFLLANYRPMKCTEDVCVFSPGGAAAASRKKGNMTYNPQGLIPVNIKKVNSEKRIGKMLNQPHHLGPNNKLTGNSEYTQQFTNYPNEILEFNIEYDTIHETQKPIKLIEHLIRTYSNENDIVLDNTMGSGTTGIGCVNTNRKFIGIELEERYYKLSKYRIIKSTQPK